MASPIWCLYEGKILYPVSGVNSASKHEHNFVDRLHKTSKGHDLSLLVLNIDEVFELFGLIAQLAIPVDDLLL